MIRTGSVGLDIALGGGWTPGTLNEVWGDPGAGKTTLAKHAAESVVRAHKNVLWLDLDGSGLYMDNMPGMIVGRPRNAEQAFMMAWHACAEPEIGLVVVDPAHLLIRQREIEGDPEYVPHPQREYRVELNELKDAARCGDTTVLFLSRPRDHERQPVRGTGISEKVLYRVHVHPDVVHQDGSREIQVTVKNTADKVVQHDAARYVINPGTGIDQAEELVWTAVRLGVIQRRASWLFYGQVKAHGVKDFADMVRQPGSRYPYLLDNDIRKMAGIS